MLSFNIVILASVHEFCAFLITGFIFVYWRFSVNIICTQLPHELQCIWRCYHNIDFKSWNFMQSVFKEELILNEHCVFWRLDYQFNFWWKIFFDIWALFVISSRLLMLVHCWTYRVDCSYELQPSTGSVEHFLERLLIQYWYLNIFILFYKLLTCIDLKIIYFYMVRILVVIQIVVQDFFAQLLFHKMETRPEIHRW